jgi:hypothetical protein
MVLFRLMMYRFLEISKIFNSKKQIQTKNLNLLIKSYLPNYLNERSVLVCFQM